MSDFWTGGHGAYLDGLKAEFEATAAELRRKLEETTTADQRRECERLLQEAEEAYRARAIRASKHLY